MVGKMVVSSTDRTPAFNDLNKTGGSTDTIGMLGMAATMIQIQSEGESEETFSECHI